MPQGLEKVSKGSQFGDHCCREWQMQISKRHLEVDISEYLHRARYLLLLASQMEVTDLEIGHLGSKTCIGKWG